MVRSDVSYPRDVGKISLGFLVYSTPLPAMVKTRQIGVVFHVMGRRTVSGPERIMVGHSAGSMGSRSIALTTTYRFAIGIQRNMRLHAGQCWYGQSR